DGVVTGHAAPLTAKPLKGLRIGVPRAFFWDDLEAETAKICEAALATLKSAGAVLVEAEIPDIAALDQVVGFTVALYEVRRDLDRYLEGEGLSARFAEIAAAAASSDVKGILGSLLDPATVIPEQLYRDAVERERPKLIEVY